MGGGRGVHNRHTKLTAIPEMLTRLSSTLLCVSSNYEAVLMQKLRGEGDQSKSSLSIKGSQPWRNEHEEHI
jgi:hypothetical protein